MHKIELREKKKPRIASLGMYKQSQIANNQWHGVGIGDSCHQIVSLHSFRHANVGHSHDFNFFEQASHGFYGKKKYYRSTEHTTRKKTI